MRGGLQTNVSIPVKYNDPAAFEKQAKTGSGAFDLKVTGVFLGAITRSSKLWEPILETQLKTGTTHVGTDDDPGYNPATFTITDADQKRFFAALQGEVRREGPQSRIFEALRYQIRADVIARTVDVLAATKDLEPDQLPKPDKYLSTTITSGVNVGLRVATHGKLVGLTSPERDSHHTTQFLFAEYFSNQSSSIPFAKGEPGVEFAGDTPVKVHRAAGGKPIDIGAVRGEPSKRGNPMPAILIARPTHQRANLHVGQSPPHDDLAPTPDKSSSQANTVDKWYRDGRGKPAAPTADETLADDTTKVGSLPEDSPVRRRNERVVAGVEKVYTEMRRTMLSALERGLLGEEAAYYEALAARRKDATMDGVLKEEWRLDRGELRKVYEHAARNNDSIMAEYGVRKP